MNMDLLSAGLRMMVLGMVMVYVFLIIMIFAMKLMSKVLKPFANALQPEANLPPRRPPVPLMSSWLLSPLRLSPTNSVNKLFLFKHI